ncbi:MAG: pantoate--beta-alanine ligase [Deltaproteobacteria bacterium]|nr:pantoate--beta-alanine ligase [Deltaproteobacteria bacterium]
MELIKETKKMQVWSREKRAKGAKLGFVPTMGFLHQGHLSLMEYARSHCDLLIVSIFVNPTQFGPAEDFKTYPQDFNRDLELMRSIPVDTVFHPAPEEIYAAGFQTYVEVTELTQGLCGVNRPTHFKGVTTVVAKLFNIVQPHLAVFGQKDYQQLIVIQRMVKDLHLEVEVVGCPTVREEDGLAMSSRNVHLSPEERKSARALSESLKLAQEMADQGKRAAAEILAAVRKHIEDQPHARLHYAVLVDPETLEDVESIEGQALLALAAVVGKPRLIDNAIITAD